MTPVWVSENGNLCAANGFGNLMSPGIGAHCFDKGPFRGDPWQTGFGLLGASGNLGGLSRSRNRFDGSSRLAAKCPDPKTVKDFPGVGTKTSQKQLRHINGRPEYRGGGYFDNAADAQAVLDAFHSGDATIIGTTSQGFPVVRYGGVTGTHVNVSAGFPKQPTNVFIIKGTASPSVVPANPNWGG